MYKRTHAIFEIINNVAMIREYDSHKIDEYIQALTNAKNNLAKGMTCDAIQYLESARAYQEIVSNGVWHFDKESHDLAYKPRKRRHETSGIYFMVHTTIHRWNNDVRFDSTDDLYQTTYNLWHYGSTYGKGHIHEDMREQPYRILAFWEISEPDKHIGWFKHHFDDLGTSHDIVASLQGQQTANADDALELLKTIMEVCKTKTKLSEDEIAYIKETTT